jgi:hypothetical protein
METTARKTGVASELDADARPILPVTTPIVEIDGTNATVNIQFNEIAMNGKPVKRKP